MNFQIFLQADITDHRVIIASGYLPAYWREIVDHVKTETESMLHSPNNKELVVPYFLNKPHIGRYVSLLLRAEATFMLRLL
jgi:hypothetical protein